MLISIKTKLRDSKKIISDVHRNIQYYINSLKIRSYSNRGIVIIGCGRSGTTFITKKFKKIGCQVGHERLLKNGICSWYLVSDQLDVPYGPNFKQIKLLKLPIVHQVRYPVDTISSCLAMGKPSYKFLNKEIPINLNQDSKLLMAMKYWYYWNLKAEQKSEYTYRVENIENRFQSLLELGNLPSFGNPKIQNKKINTRKHKSITWKDLFNEDYDLSINIMELGNKYGYEIQE